MSEPIPESVPTSADPRSQRPTKKPLIHAPATAIVASQIEALFRQPDQEIRIASTGTRSSNELAAPPEIVQNVQGSSAGAGSGEFHVYKASRRREYERLKRMDEEVEKDEDLQAYTENKNKRKNEDEECTRKKREKREKKKSAKGKTRNTAKQTLDGQDSQKASEIPHKPIHKPNSAVLRNREDIDSDTTNPDVAIIEEPVGLIIHDED